MIEDLVEREGRVGEAAGDARTRGEEAGAASLFPARERLDRAAARAPDALPGGVVRRRPRGFQAGRRPASATVRLGHEPPLGGPRGPENRRLFVPRVPGGRPVRPRSQPCGAGVAGAGGGRWGRPRARPSPGKKWLLESENKK